MVGFRHTLSFICMAMAGFAAMVGAAGSPAHAIETTAREAILVDTTTGEVLLEKNADTRLAPASMSKMMAVYLLFERLRDGSLSLDDTYRVSETAWRRGGARSGSSTMFLEPGQRVRVEDLVRGIIVQSGNDACIVVAEALSGTEEVFAQEMTERARELGLENTVFTNSTGWPDPDQFSTVRDLAHLARRTIEDFPDYYHYYAEIEYTYNGIRQINRNPLLYKDMDVDGLKTGHTKDSGYGLAAAAKRGGRRLILVVNGLSSKKERSQESERLLEWGFREFDTYPLFEAGEEVVRADVWLGVAASVPLAIEDALVLTLARKLRRDMKVTVTFDNPIPAPVRKGQKVARLQVSLPDRDAMEFPLVAADDVERLGLFGRLAAALKYILWGASG